MPALTTAITYLTLSGTPGAELLNTTSHGEEMLVDKSVSDTISLVLTEGEFLERDYELFDQIVPVVGNTAVPGLARATSDTLRPVLTDLYVSLVKAGNLAFATSDTLRPVVTDFTYYDAAINVSDGAVPVITETATAVAVTDVMVVTDSLVAVLTDAAAVATYTPASDVAVSDSLVAVLTDISGVGQFNLLRDVVVDDVLHPFVAEALRNVGRLNDVDRITIHLSPIGYIRITEA